MKRAIQPFYGLRFKLSLSILLTVVVFITVMSVTVLSVIRQELLSQMLVRADLLCRSIERLVRVQREFNDVPAGVPLDPDTLQRILGAFSDEDYLLGLALEGPGSQNAIRQGRFFSLPPGGWKAFAGGGDWQTLPGDRSSLIFRRNFLGPSSPLKLHLLFSLDKTQQVIALLQLRTIFQISLAAFLIFLFLLVILTFMVIRPLGTLSRGIEKIAAGNLDHRVEAGGRDELGFLASSFNNMVAALKESRDTIQGQLKSLREAHQATIDAQGKLIAAEKLASLGTLAAGVAHEVGNPLQAITGYIDLLQRGRLSREEEADCLSRAAAEITRIHQIMLELLNYARPSAESSSPLKVNEILCELLDALRREGEMEGMEVGLDLQPDLPHPAGFPHKLEQVFTNLVRNAVWATGHAGRLEVRTRSAGPGEDGRLWLELTFADDGRGIRPEDLKRIYDPFFSTRLGQGGTGLGLAISKRIVEEMDGTITVESAPGRGTTFVIRLPV